jgi:molecular chaperone GrpE
VSSKRPNAANPEDSADELAGGSISPGDELAAALAEATEAVLAKPTADSGAPGDGASPDKLMIEALSSELQSIKGEYEERLAEYEELKDQNMRLQAEFENFRRRSLKERQEAFQYGHQDIIKDLLTTIDNLDRASEHAEGSGAGDLQALLEGVALVSRELLGVFGKYGVSTIEAQNRPFDPALHEAMGQLEDTSVPPNTVVQVLQTGYMLRDRMLRPSLVMVSRLPEGAHADAKSGKPSAGSSEEGPTE